RLPEADGELLDADAYVLGGEEVTQLVEEDHEAEAETEEGDAPDLRNQRIHARFSFVLVKGCGPRSTDRCVARREVAAGGGDGRGCVARRVSIAAPLRRSAVLHQGRRLDPGPAVGLQ